MRRALDSSTLVLGLAGTRRENSCAASAISSSRELIQPRRPSTAIAGNSHSKESAPLLGTLTGTPFSFPSRETTPWVKTLRLGLGGRVRSVGR